MARLAATGVLLSLLVVALCRVIDGEEVAAVSEVVVPDNNETYNYNAVPIPADTDVAATDDEAAAHRHFMLVMSPEGEVRPAYFDDQGVEVPLPPSHWHRHRHGFLRHGEGFQAEDQEKHMVAIEPANYGHGGESREAVALPVVEPDPDSRPADSAAVSLQEVQKPADFHAEGEHDDEMAKAWRRFHHGRRFHHHRRRHHDQDEHGEQDDHDHEEADEVSPVKRFRVNHHHRHHEEEDEHEQREEADAPKGFRHHHHEKEDDSDDEEDELEEMARRLIRKALMRGRMPHHSRRRFHHHHLRCHHRAEDAAAGEEEKGGVMKWIKDFVNQF